MLRDKPKHSGKIISFTNIQNSDGGWKHEYHSSIPSQETFFIPTLIKRHMLQMNFKTVLLYNIPIMEFETHLKKFVLLV